MLRQRLINLDNWAGRWLDLRLPAYIEERWSAARQGSYSAEEWSRARSAGYRGNDDQTALLDTDAGYREQLATHNAPAVSAAERLARRYDFSRHRAVLEIGCGEMAQACILTQRHPHLRYRATDFDPFVIEKCARLPLLAGIEKAVLDVTRLTPADLAGFDLLLSWELIYALDDEALRRLFCTARAAGVPFLAGTTQLLGPLRYAKRALRNLDWRPGGFHYTRLTAAGKLRMHGWNPSIAHYARLAHEEGLVLDWVELPPAAARDPFAFLTFRPRSP